MGSKYYAQSIMENIGIAYNHAIGINSLEEASKSYLMNEKIKLVGELAAGVAQEIRDPLTSINDLVQLLNSRVTKPEYLSMIYSELNKVEEIVNKLIKFAETQSVNFRLNDIGHILDRTIKSMNDLALVKGINIISNIEGECLSIYCDEVQLQHVFENIIKNAIEASACNKEIYFASKKNESHIHIMIKDKGIGISDERIVHLFEPFYCIKERGTGFGLMMSHKIIQEHFGTIQVKSELEIGTTVDIYLPLLNS